MKQKTAHWARCQTYPFYLSLNWNSLHFVGETSVTVLQKIMNFYLTDLLFTLHSKIWEPGGFLAFYPVVVIDILNLNV